MSEVGRHIPGAICSLGQIGLRVSRGAVRIIIDRQTPLEITQDEFKA